MTGATLPSVADREIQIAFVTGSRWPDLSPDDRIAAEVLGERGFQVRPAIWTDPEVRWGEFELVVLRSCWDYFLHPAIFVNWLDRLEEMGVQFLNPFPTVRWNFDKVYLKQLEDRGIPVIPTEIELSGHSIAEVMDARGWESAVIKPRVSGSGHNTFLLSRAEAALRQTELDGITSGAGALIQPFVEEVAQKGELSFVFIGGRYSHAVCKRPAPGDFRVQSIHGGTVARINPPGQLVADAASVLSVIPHGWSYARVDGCVVGGRLLLMELEMIEPALFFGYSKSAPLRFADEIQRRVAAHEAIR